MNRHEVQVRKYIVLALTSACLWGCSNTPAMVEPTVKSAKEASKKVTAAPAAQEVGKPAAAPTEMRAVSGTVVETMAVSGYSYVCLDNAGKKEWAAIPLGKIEKGSVLSLRPGMVMHNFHSKTLDRSFDEIVFSEGPVQTAQAQPAASVKTR